MRTTQSLVQVAAVLLEDSDASLWGYEIGRRADVRSGVLYPMLHRLLNAGWLTDSWQPDPEEQGRPPRRYYTLTGLGVRELSRVLARSSSTRASVAGSTQPFPGRA